MSAGGWTGKLLRVDLSTGKLESDDTLRYADYIGGRGIAARLAWEELPAGVGAFDPRNPLIFVTGPLTGSTAPYSGRTEVCGLGPQGWPSEWFTRAGMGGHWSPTLKYAGWDGIVVKGQADHPVYLLISDDKVELRDARALWGKGIYETQESLIAEHGPETRVACIGQAGENLSRIAIIATETESAAGQGGFGAVMGAKRLKAIAVQGSGAVRVARPDEFLRASRAIAKESHAPHGSPDGRPAPPPGLYKGKWQACTQQCSAQCAQYFRDVPGVVCQGQKYSGQLHCVANIFPGRPGTFYDWNVGFEAGFEASKMANDWGLNHWDLLLGIFPWLRACREAGLLEKVDELPIDLNDPHFWAGVMRKITFREGLGDVLAEGGWRAHLQLGLGQETMRELYTAWGYAGHWDGHGARCNRIVYPYWLVAALQWAVDTRDPMSSGHGYTQNVMGWSPFGGYKNALSWEKLLPIAERLYGDRSAFDPLSGYEGKEVPAYWHANRSVLKDSLIVDDQMFPRIFSTKTPDGYARTEDPPMEGPDFEYHLYVAATGVDWSKEQLEQACDRVFNLERAIQIRNHGRTRGDDESVIDAFQLPEWWVNPLIGEKQGMDPTKFRALLSEYYRLRGWDVATGHPTRERLEKLGLADVAAELATGPAAEGVDESWPPRTRARSSNEGSAGAAGLAPQV
ncbi:MAG: aldehyde ferredoxin oxidoreductase N-terminal domain-containing protein [Chloroflexota bacterium]